MPIADLLAGSLAPGKRITHTPASSIGADLAWNEDRLALVWCDAIDGQQDLYFQKFVEGVPENAVQRLTRTATQSSIPSIRAFGQGFAAAWNEYQAVGEGTHREILTSEARVALLP